VFGGVRIPTATPVPWERAESGRRTWRRREVVVRGDDREADEGGGLGKRADGDEDEGDKKVLVHEVEACRSLRVKRELMGG
jgi:hypothetical protein